MSRYSDAVEDGYDGPSPFEERRMEARRRNNPSDCRDPDHEPCELCGEDCDEDE